MKTTLRYLLIVVAMVGFLSVNAQEANQSWGQKPEIQMKSTSVMVGSGSTLPQAAVTGVSTTYDEGNGSNPKKTGPRKGSFNPGGEPGPDEGENSEPWEDPIGDAMIPLVVLAAVYGVWCRDIK